MEGGLGGGGGGGDGGGGWWYLRIKSNWRGIHKQWKREIIIQKKKSKKKTPHPGTTPGTTPPAPKIIKLKVTLARKLLH